MFEISLTVGSQHLDSLAHVNNVIYLQWMQDVAWAHSIFLGMDMTAYQTLDAAMVARHHDMTYLSACFTGDELILKTWLTENDGFNLIRHYEFVRRQDNKTVFKGQTHWVCIRLSSGRPMRMPVEFKNAYAVS